jgi:hypothetical protein
VQKIGNGQNGSERTLSESELSQICERLGSDLVQCIGPIVMCFPQVTIMLHNPGQFKGYCTILEADCFLVPSPVWFKHIIALRAL